MLRTNPTSVHTLQTAARPTGNTRGRHADAGAPPTQAPPGPTLEGRTAQQRAGDGPGRVVAGLRYGHVRLLQRGPDVPEARSPAAHAPKATRELRSGKVRTLPTIPEWEPVLRPDENFAGDVARALRNNDPAPASEPPYKTRLADQAREIRRLSDQNKVLRDVVQNYRPDPAAVLAHATPGYIDQLKASEMQAWSSYKQLRQRHARVIETLQRQKSEAESAVKAGKAKIAILENKLDSANEAYRAHVQECTRKISDLAGEAGKSDALGREIAELAARNKTAETEIGALRSELADAKSAQAEKAALIEKNENLLHENAQLAEEVQALGEEVARLEAFIGQIECSLEEEKAFSAEALAVNKKCEQRIRALTARVQELDETLQGKKSEIEKRDETVKTLERAVQHSVERYGELHRSYAPLPGQIEKLTEANQRLRELNTSLLAQLQAARRQAGNPE
ncbi:hypothetical protein NCCP691_19680 [Noviherbaspirillum aridicola]|uniref:Plasmid replication DNA-binding protein KfrA n=2 Tax=Noviherbaspirillum aridicola TaxID=2849687 RepID=A0ABQ4Q4B3_9BURK|nr:hypothetical protein NCCP691_19680 [Noviherbaspirillum aridicola]